MMRPIFNAFPKIPRWNRHIQITEKIDGSNGQIIIRDVTTIPDEELNLIGEYSLWNEADWAMFAASRSKLIRPGKQTDNFGFAAWVKANAPALSGLGLGEHSGEWWGSGIQRGYGLVDGERRFSLFNVSRWSATPEDGTPEQSLPAVEGLGVVPVLYRGPMHTMAMGDMVAATLQRLQFGGSVAARGFKNPEGVIVWHTASRSNYKVTVDGDQHKG